MHNGQYSKFERKGEWTSVWPVLPLLAFMSVPASPKKAPLVKVVVLGDAGYVLTVIQGPFLPFSVRDF